jgi:hypothetical protein
MLGSNLTANQNNATFVQYIVKTGGGTFSIDHPNPKLSDELRLNHSFVESPTAGDNIYRFNIVVVNGEAIIDLPDYFKYLNKDAQVWITPKNGFGIAYGVIDDTYSKITIKANLDIEYDVLVIGTRKDKNTKFWKGAETPQPKRTETPQSE